MKTDGPVRFYTGFKLNGDFGSYGELPEPKEFDNLSIGDLVIFSHTCEPRFIGMIIERTLQDVEYDGLLGRLTIKLRFFKVLFNNGKIVEAGEHMLHQLERLR